MAVDFFGKITEFNRGAEKLFGWTKDEVLNKENIGITILLEDRDRDIQKEISKQTRTEGFCEMEMLSCPFHRYRHKGFYGQNDRFRRDCS